LFCCYHKLKIKIINRSISQVNAYFGEKTQVGKSQRADVKHL